MVYISNQYKIQKQNQVGQHVTHTDTRRNFCSWGGGGGSKPKKAQHGQMITKKSAKSFNFVGICKARNAPPPPSHGEKNI